jgi:hypothetical protein
MTPQERAEENAEHKRAEASRNQDRSYGRFLMWPVSNCDYNGF